MKIFYTFVLSLIPDSLITYGIMIFFGKQGWESFFIILLVLESFYLIRWLFQSIVGWLSYIFIWKKNIVDGILTNLHSNKFPNPDDYGFSKSFPEGYYNAIINDRNLEKEVTDQARIYINEIWTLRNLGQLQAIFRILNAHGESISMYQNSF